MKHLLINGFHNLPLYCTIYSKVESPKAVILIIHGMQEHSGRYKKFAEMLNQNGYIVVTSDSRGHGKTMKSTADYGKGEKDIYLESVNDQLQIIEYIKAHILNLPIYLFGHSYGSMISQKLLQVSKDISKIVLCGTTCGTNASFIAGKLLANVLSFFGQSNKSASAIEKMSLKKWGKSFENQNWLSRDDKVFAEYNCDVLCGGSFPISFYKSLFSNMTKVNKNIKTIEPNKKILLIVGSEDPVGNKSKLVTKLYKKYKKANVDAQLIVYDGARHELINEINKSQVYNDILNFYNN